MCYVFIMYGQLLTSRRTAVDLKQLINTRGEQAFSSRPDADYRCYETWNFITSTLSFDAMSCLQSSGNTWLRHLCSAGLPRDSNCHCVSMGALEAPVWGEVFRSQVWVLSNVHLNPQVAGKWECWWHRWCLKNCCCFKPFQHVWPERYPTYLEYWS